MIVVIKIIVITIIVIIIIIIIIIDRKYCRDLIFLTLYAVFTESPSLNEDLKFEE